MKIWVNIIGFMALLVFSKLFLNNIDVVLKVCRRHS